MVSLILPTDFEFISMHVTVLTLLIRLRLRDIAIQMSRTYLRLFLKKWQFGLTFGHWFIDFSSHSTLICL